MCGHFRGRNLQGICIMMIFLWVVQTSGYESVLGAPSDPLTAAHYPASNETLPSVGGILGTLTVSTMSVERDGSCDAMPKEKDWVEVQRRRKMSHEGLVKVQFGFYSINQFAIL